MPAGMFFDLATIHVLTTATINRLRELYPQGRFEVRRFRPNIVVRPDNDDAEFVESKCGARTSDRRRRRARDHRPLPALRHDHTSARRSPQGQRDPAHSGTPQRSTRRRVWRGASRRESPARRHRDPRLSTHRADGHFFTRTTPRYWFPARLAPLHRAFFRAGVTGIRWSRVSWGTSVYGER